MNSNHRNGRTDEYVSDKVEDHRMAGDRTPLSKSKEREGFELPKFGKNKFRSQAQESCWGPSFGCSRLSSRAQIDLKHNVGV